MKKHIYSALAVLLCGIMPAQAQLTTYCLEGGSYTCFALELATAPDAAGTRVTLRLANLEGAGVPGVASQVPWSRIYAVELIGPTTGFGGSWLVDAEPEVATTGAAEAVGDTRARWFLGNVGGEGGAYRGYRLETPYEEYGADIVGCALPPEQDYPYFRTCQSEGQGAVEFAFRTEGTWEASEAAIVIGLQDQYADDMLCIISGSLFDDPEAFHCTEIGEGGGGGEEEKLPASIDLENLGHVYDGAPKYATVSTDPAGLSGVAVRYSLGGAPVADPVDAGSYEVVASLVSDTYEADDATGVLVIARAPQAINFAALADRTVNESPFDLSAVGGGSDSPVTFGTLTPEVCAVSGSTVSLAGVGTCTLTADQAGTANYEPAPQVRQSFQVTYPFSGFFRPISNPPSANRVNAGRSIPLKFSLQGDRGRSVFETGYPISQQVSCSTGAPIGRAEETATAGGSGLMYDPGADQYTYVWKTSKAWRATCRQMTVRLADGTDHVANFRFTR